MTEHKICKGCRWNKYPLCEGTKMEYGFINIENQSPDFICGQKDEPKLTDFSIVKKSELELKVEVLEKQIRELLEGK